MNRRYLAIVVMIVALVGAMVMMRGRKEFRGCAGVVWTTEYHITYERDRWRDDSVQVVFT